MDVGQTITQMYAEACQKYSNSPVFTALGCTMTFAELDQQSSQFAAYLQENTSLQPGDRVALQLPNLLQYPVAAFGIFKAGLVLVNTNPLYTGRELLHQLHDSGAKAIVVLENFAHVVSQILEQTDLKYVFVARIGDMHPTLKRVLLNFGIKYLKRAVPGFDIPRKISFRKAVEEGANCTLTPVTVNPQELAVLQYTGGTTGIAKGAMLSHANLVANMQQACEHLPDVYIEQKETIAAPLPLYHIYAFTMHLMCATYTGNHSVLIPNPRDTGSIVKIFKDFKITCFIGLNTLYNSLLQDVSFCGLDFSGLRNCSAGGMALTSDTAKRWRKLTGCTILEGYGLTEASPVVSSNQNGHVVEGSIGKPVPNTEVKLAEDDGSAVPAGESGELWVRGPQVMIGYWKRPDETAKVLTEDGWLKTGDIAQIDEEGFVRIVDRKKDMILVSGFKVFPNEVEEVVSMHPGILECAVIGAPDDESGEVVKLFVVSSDPTLKEQEVRSFCRERLTGYKIPKHVVFLKELPKSNVGKILRRELR